MMSGTVKFCKSRIIVISKCGLHRKFFIPDVLILQKLVKAIILTVVICLLCIKNSVMFWLIQIWLFRFASSCHQKNIISVKILLSAINFEINDSFWLILKFGLEKLEIFQRQRIFNFQFQRFWIKIAQNCCTIFEFWSFR